MLNADPTAAPFGYIEKWKIPKENKTFLFDCLELSFYALL